MPGFQYQEGGGKYPPYQEDYFQRIVNVQWLGVTGLAHVLLGDFCCFSCYVEAPLKGVYTKKPLGSPVYGDHGDIYSGSYHNVNDRQPTFLMGGDTDGSVYTRGGVIVWSPDGQNLIPVYTVEIPSDPEVAPENVFATVYGIVWDGTQFWAGAHTIAPYYTSGGTWIKTVDTDILLSSTDGQHWAVADSRVTAVNSPSGETSDPTVIGLLPAHCNPRVKDSNGNAVPDGIYHYSSDPVTGTIIFIRPDTVPAIDYTHGGVKYDNMGPTITIEVTQSGHTVTKNVDTGLGSVDCVAYADGVIVAAGEGRGPDGIMSSFAVSVDMGDTWQQPDFYSPDFPPVTTINAAPQKDFIKKNG